MFSRTLVSMAMALCLCATAVAQLNIQFVGQLNYQTTRSSNLSNLWGYTDELGNEYALVGVCGVDQQNPGGIAVVDLTDPANPQEIFFFPGPTSIWREIKVWDDHAYITTEAESGGITIVDLSPLPQSTDLTAIVWDAPDWETSHSLFIDENGRLYIHGADRGNGGVIMYDLTQDPMDPVEVGAFDNWYCHDSFARGDTLYGAHIYDGFFSIVDVSDPSAPVLLGTRSTPNDFTHNVWLDDSGDHIFTTDERTDSYVGSYNISDPSDIEYLDQLQSDAGSGAIPHNTYWLNDYLVTSYYTYGVVIYDASRPDNLIEVGHYDTSPFSGDGFRGAWGVYPFFGSERLIISDMEQGLFILDPAYVRACWLEGLITNSLTTVPVAGASIVITGTGNSDLTAIGGTYATGYHTAGSYEVTVSAPGYFPQTITGVQLLNGEVTVLNVALVPMPSFTLLGTVIEQGSATPIGSARVEVRNDLFDLATTTLADGTFGITTVFEDSYGIKAGRWGWHTVCNSNVLLDENSSPYTIELPKGYRDEFTLDLGWTVTSTAPRGGWERGAPVGTTFNNATANPEADLDDDCGVEAFVTGNGGGAPGDDDVDDGSTTLVSPVFDVSVMLDAHVRYQRWFFNAGGSGTPNDRLVVQLSNGAQTVTVETVTTATPGMGSWQPVDLRIADFLEPTADMTIRFVAQDDLPGHLLEAGVDGFEVVDLGSTEATPDRTLGTLRVWPVPSTGEFNVELQGTGNTSLTLHDAMGRQVWSGSTAGRSTVTVDAGLPDGLYRLTVVGNGGSVTRPVLIIR